MTLPMACLFFVAIVGIVYGSLNINESLKHERENEESIYLKDEQMWNNTYRQQLDNLNISFILDAGLYDQTQKSIEVEELKIEAYEKEEQSPELQ